MLNFGLIPDNPTPEDWETTARQSQVLIHLLEAFLAHKQNIEFAVKYSLNKAIKSLHEDEDPCELMEYHDSLASAMMDNVNSNGETPEKMLMLHVSIITQYLFGAMAAYHLDRHDVVKGIFDTIEDNLLSVSRAEELRQHCRDVVMLCNEKVAN